MTHQTETSPAPIVTRADIDAAKLYLQGTGPWKLDEIGIGPDDSLVQAFARHRQHAYDHGYYDGRTYDMGQPQTDARVADLLFKLDVAATTFDKVTTSEHREAVFNAEHAKLLRDTIKVLHQPQTDAAALLASIREPSAAMIEKGYEAFYTAEIPQHPIGVAFSAMIDAALKESK